MDENQTTQAASALAQRCAQQEGTLHADIPQARLTISRWREAVTLQLASSQKPPLNIIAAIERVFAIQPGNATTTPLAGRYITQWNGAWTVHDSRS